MSTTDRRPIVRICFVCTGNICRSPMAEVMFRQMVEEVGLGDDVSIASAGTGEWHVGERVDPRTRQALDRAGYRGELQRARQFELAWFSDFDLIITFDRGQRRILRSWAPTQDDRALIRPLLSFLDDSGPEAEILDPYYGNDELFDQVRDQIEAPCRALLQQMLPVVRAAKMSRPPTAPVPEPAPKE
ncbi:low molecular weight protein-tyrosine-phosphatase [Pseudoclavibacter endophyticus]|uniref:protein-tyrosine-phosphatase n=1 Tax=Pseudoclavibacter endophyticus TaxID=1778590 RepID=A0A6H9WPB2_9MICO|nr:low molecular weight protein-tyrosine-phosphatase [Pseudoclavibacter endophyticus]KAB1648857.1 low molecular weight phosphotyrosine protein phosphatase [Pseudoclavibacter endophyticus]